MLNKFPHLRLNLNGKKELEEKIIAERNLITEEVKKGIQSSPTILNRTALNEAQANSISQLALYSLIVMNDNGRMPGTQDDPYPVSPISLYRMYEETILKRKNPFHPLWLQQHRDWGK